MRTLILGLLMCLALPAMADIYKYKDADGSTVFTDHPPKGVKAEVVRKRLTILPDSPVPSQPSSPSLDALQEDAGPAYETIALTGLPEQNGSLRANGGAFSVGVLIRPALRPGHHLRLLLDGKPYADSDGRQGFALKDISRGEHSLQLQVLAGNQVVQQGDQQVFTVQRVALGAMNRSRHR